jgi:hypothetical protein
MTARAVTALVAVGLVASGCAETAFSAHARDNDLGDLQRALAASAPPPVRAGHPMAFVVGEGKLVGFDLADGKMMWQTAADVRSRVVVGAGAIAHRQGERDLVVRAAATGDVRATASLGRDETFVGAALDGDGLIYVVATADKRSVITALDGGGRTAWRHETQSALGAPAARGGLVAVPFAHQNLVLLEGGSGRELARVRATDEALSFARALPEGIYYGGAHGVYRLDDKSVSGSRAGSSWAEAKLPSEQVRAAYFFDGYEPAQAVLGAFDRNRLLWRGRDGGAGFRDDLAVLHSFRFFFAFDARAGKLRWAYGHPRTDVIASENAGGAVVFASADGDIGLIDTASGKARIVQRTGLRLKGASFDAEGLAGGVPAPAPSAAELAKTLEEVLWDHDARFSAVKVFAVGALADVPGVTVAQTLLKIVRAPTGTAGVPPAAQARAGEALVARKDRAAVPLLLEALGEHYDFVENRQPRGLDVIARALGALGVREAAPLIAAHLGDHETPEPVLKDLAATLAALGGNDALRALRELLLQYHADPAFAGDPTALATAGEALLRAGGEAKKTVAYVVDDPRTLAPLRGQLRASLEAGQVAPARAQ